MVMMLVMQAGLAARSLCLARALACAEALFRGFHALGLEHDGLGRSLERANALGK